MASRGRSSDLILPETAICRRQPPLREGEAAFLNPIDGIEPSSGTPLVASLLESFNALRELRGRQRVSVLVTDAAESCGGSLQEAVNRARDANTRVIVIGSDIDSPGLLVGLVRADGERVSGGLTGRGSAEVPEGIFTVAVRTAGDPVIVEDVPIREGQPTRVEIKKEGEEIGGRVVPPPEPGTNREP